MLIMLKIVKMIVMKKQRQSLGELLIVGFGGGIGGSLRYLLSLIPIIGYLPLMTVTINWLGAFLLALFGAYLTKNSSQLTRWQPFIGTGIIGGFTTFSTMILQFNQLLRNNLQVAWLYIILTVFGGILMVRLGQKVGRTV
ncbi:CrcB family protein [Leuconostoc rapi]